MRVLVVEDENALGMFLQKGMKLEGHEVEWVGDGEAAVERAQRGRPDLMLLDLGLPRRDGVQVLEALQGRLQRTGVVVLTGRRDIEERVKCLDLGADDCLLKPFSLKELAARCRAVVRRRSAATDPVLNAGGVEMNRLEHTVRCDGRAVELTGKEYALLEFLMLRAGDCVTRAQLLESVWRMQPEAGTNVVDVYVNYLRKKLSVEGAGGDEVIETVRGSGYRLRAEGPVQAGVAVKKAVQSAVPLATVVRVVEAG